MKHKTRFAAVAAALSILFAVIASAAETLTVNKTKLLAKDAEGSYVMTLEIDAPSDWTIELPAWITTFSQLSGKAGKHNFNLHIFSNSSDTLRKGMIRVQSGDETVNVEVEQEKVFDRLAANTGKMELCDLGYARELRISSSYKWKLTPADDWLKPSLLEGEPGVTFIKIAAAENKDTERSTTMTLQFTNLPANVPAEIAGKNIKIAVTQGKAGDYWDDGSVLWINKHTKGEGVPVLIVGDGFDREDLKKGGYWETAGRTLAGLLEKVMVFKDLYDRIDVGIYMAESKERGVESKDYRHYIPQRDTQFNARQWGEYNGGKVRRILENIPEIKNKRAIRFCFVANGPFGGWAYLDNNSFMSVVQVVDSYWAAHEFIGHAFSGLPDLYHTGDDYAYRRCENIDFTNDPEKVKWKAFLGKEEYVQAGIGIHKHGEHNGKTVYVAEPHGRSTMNGGNAYFTALERYQIWKFILRSSGADEADLTPEKFFEFDIPKYVGKHDKYPLWRTECPPMVTTWWADLWKVDVGQ